MKRVHLTLAFALAVASAPAPARAGASDPSNLPVYTYSIRSGSFETAGILMSSFAQPIPSSMWRCAIYYAGSGLTARCTYAGLGETGVAIRATCAYAKEDSQTVNLTMLGGGYASVSIACRKLEAIDDGF